MTRRRGEPSPFEAPTLSGVASSLDAHLAIVARGAIDVPTCAAWARGVLAAKREWTEDFDGDQYCLGRAFYTHVETDRAREYFDDAAASNERVERRVPGLQEALRASMSSAVLGRVVARPGWCGAGVHVFPRRHQVARAGGAIHFDTEGLATPHVAARKRALSLVVMLQPSTGGGGLRLWNLRYDGRDRVDPATRRKAGDAVVQLHTGDALLFDSYRLHQIQPFSGPRHRLTAALHAAELHDGLWESWF